MSAGSKILGFIGVLGVMASSLAFVLLSGKEVPTVGLVAPVFAAAPERVELRALKQDETLGELLEGVLDANAQYGLILALRERANPRRLHPGTEVAFRWLTAAPSELRAVDITIDADLTVRMTPSPAGWTSSVMTTPVVMDTVWNEEGAEREPTVIINPQILTREGQIEWEEGCLSVPDFTADVERSEHVVVRYTNLEGEQVTEDVTGLRAVCFQHEIDHLDGILFIDRISRLKRSLYVKRRKKQLREEEEPARLGT